MNKLIYAPHSLFSPEREILHTIAITELKNNHDVEIVYCRGGACSANPISLRSLCRLCVQKSDELSESLQKVYPDNLKISFYENIDHSPIQFNNEIKNEKYKNEDLGYAVLSTYIGITRDFEPNLNNNKVNSTLSSLANTFKSTYDYLDKKLQSNVYNTVHVFNGRLNNSRAVLRSAMRNNVPVIAHELVGMEDKTQQFINCLPHDLKANQDKIEKVYKLYKEDAEKIANDFYLQKKHGQAVNDKSYVSKQNEIQLPELWSSKKRNITFFTSSEDEFKAIGKEWEGGVFENQLLAIKGILDLLSVEKDSLYVRIHPNVKSAAKKHLRTLMELKHPCLQLIHPSSKVSSYLLMVKSDLVITYGSTIGVEAAYWGKPSILLSNSFYKGLGSTYEPKSYEELKHILKVKDLKPLDSEGAIKLGVYYSKNGEVLEGFKGSQKTNYSFYNNTIKFNYIEKLIYFICKVYQKAYVKCFLS